MPGQISAGHALQSYAHLQDFLHIIALHEAEAACFLPVLSAESSDKPILPYVRQSLHPSYRPAVPSGSALQSFL